MKNLRVTVAAALLGAAILPSAISAETITYAGNGFAIPDVSDHTSTITVADMRAVQSVTFTLNGLTHTFLGDLYGTLGHGGASSTYFDRATSSGADLNGNYRFSDAARSITPVNGSQGDPIPSGTYVPFTPLSVFNGMSAAGDWVLTLNDEVSADVGNLDSWSLAITYADAGATGVPEPATWGMMILGFGLVAATMRRQRQAPARSFA